MHFYLLHLSRLRLRLRLLLQFHLHHLSRLLPVILTQLLHLRLRPQLLLQLLLPLRQHPSRLLLHQPLLRSTTPI